MAKQNFNSDATKGIIVIIECKCGRSTESAEIELKLPNQYSNIFNNDIEKSKGTAICKCGKQYDIDAYVTKTGGWVEILSLHGNENIQIDELQFYESEFDEY